MPRRWNEWIRAHWRIENGSHYVRDTAFAEDASRIRKNPDIAARLRSFAYNLIRAAGKGAAMRKAASLFTGGGPGAMLAFSAATPPAVKSLRQRRTVSSRTPNASAILGLVQPARVSSTARARSASPRPREIGKSQKGGALLVARRTETFPPYHCESVPAANCRKPIRWLTKRNLLRFNRLHGRRMHFHVMNSLHFFDSTMIRCWEASFT